MSSHPRQLAYIQAFVINKEFSKVCFSCCIYEWLLHCWPLPLQRTLPTCASRDGRKLPSKCVNPMFRIIICIGQKKKKKKVGVAQALWAMSPCVIAACPVSICFLHCFVASMLSMYSRETYTINPQLRNNTFEIHIRNLYLWVYLYLTANIIWSQHW